MKTLKQLCTPRSSVFDKTKRDIVLDLTDLAQDKIKPVEFFEENYLTDGMKRLFRETFRRFAGKSEQGVFKLTQAMGGGKTHNLIALGLLAKHPEIRAQVMSDIHEVDNLAAVRVVVFSGRENDAPFGIWGAIAEQLGKKDFFKDYYAPLSAPGQTAWVNLLQGEPLLILLDELPPYFQAARAKQIGNSDLSEVTTTALANLLVAVGKGELGNVCVVISDLRASYAEGTEQVQRALLNLEHELGRTALNLEPVGLNTDEIYHILRKRIFKNLPDENEVKAVAMGYAQAVRDANQMEITTASPEKFSQQIMLSYPFHPAIKDLYARFRENQNFQQTRGLIRLMRTIAANLFSTNGKADQIYLIGAHDLDLNDRDTLVEITQINPTLENAISHDIAALGKAVAETMDANLKGADTRDVCKLLLVSSLANVPNALQGLSYPEIISFLCAPGRNLARLNQEILRPLSTSAWYLHVNHEGKLFFKNVQNIVAKLKTTAESYAYNPEIPRKELRKQLEQMFEPQVKDCYQEVRPLPALDEGEINRDRVTLIIYEPNPGGGLHRDLQKFYDDQVYKNRILFLSGQRGTMQTLLTRAAELKAIHFIIGEMESEKIPSKDPQFVNALDIRDKLHLQFYSAVRETFTTLTYPHGEHLMSADFLMNFKGNEYHGEQQVRETLKSKMKFTEDISSPIFRQKCEERLFTQKTMPWNEIKRRAAMTTKWQWHKPDALDTLKNDLIFKDLWRENGGFVEKPPFPKPATSIRIQESFINDDTGSVILKLTPVFGDTIFYEIGRNKVTTASARVPDPKSFETNELIVTFLCVDRAGEHETGESLEWHNRIQIKSRIFGSGKNKMVELRAAPNAPIRYTTEGSDPKNNGGIYNEPFAIPPQTQVILAVAEKDGILSEVHRLPIDWSKDDGFKIDPARPATLKRHYALNSTQEVYDALIRFKKYEIVLPAPRIIVEDKSKFLELSSGNIEFDAEKLEQSLQFLRGLFNEGQVALEVEALKFASGEKLLDWIEEMRIQVSQAEVIQ